MLRHLTNANKCFDFSRTDNGVYCTPCALFGNVSAGGNELLTLVKQPLKRYVNICEKLRDHLNTKYHQFNVVKSMEMIRLKKCNNSDVSLQLKSHLALQI